MIADVLGNLLVLSVRQGSLRAQEGAAHGRPPVDGLPGHALDVSVDEAFDAVVDAERIVT